MAFAEALGEILSKIVQLLFITFIYVLFFRTLCGLKTFLSSRPALGDLVWTAFPRLLYGTRFVILFIMIRK